MQKARSGPRPNPHRGAVCATERECLMLTALALFLAACLAGVVNALAGGGLLFTFPALVAVGVPPLLANATANIASWPGYVSAAVAMRRELGQHRRWLRLLLITGVTGGITGAALLKVISPGFFSYLVPWLLLLASLFGVWLLSVRRKLETQEENIRNAMYQTLVQLSAEREALEGLAEFLGQTMDAETFRRMKHSLESAQTAGKVGLPEWVAEQQRELL